MLRSFLNIIRVGVERGVATRGTQVVWPLMTVTAIQSAKMPKMTKINILAELLPSEALKTCSYRLPDLGLSVLPLAATKKRQCR